MHKCQKCLYDTQHPFHLTLNDKICSGCITHEEKNTLDWSEREQKLLEIISPYRKDTKAYYNCVVPVQGDAEDYYVLNIVLSLGLRPLVVAVNDYFKNNIGWYNLHNLITHFDCDSFVFNPDMTVYKELIRTTLRKYNHMLWPALALHSAYPVHIAKARKIPLIIWGQNQALEQVGKYSHCDQIEMSQWSRQEHDILNCSLETVIGNGAQLNTRHLNYYRYPNIKALIKSRVRGLYLSNFYRWDPLQQNHSMMEFGFQPEVNNSSFDPYERAGSSVYYQMHDLLKMQRVGYRKIRDHLSREIRHQRISRNSAIHIEKYYSEARVDIDSFFAWLDVTESGKRWFVENRLQKVSHLLASDNSGEWVSPELPEDITALLDKQKASEKQFITFGKGV